MQEHGLATPCFEELGGEFRLTLVGPGERFMQTKALPQWLRGLNERQLKGLERLKSRGRITNHEYQQLNSVTRFTALRDLADLVTRQLIEQVGSKGPGVYYVPTDRLRG